MSEKNVNTRIIHKHDTEINWSKATNFKPKQGEIIIYDKDDNYNYERIKVGDGVTLVNDLPFYGSSIENILDGIASGSVRTSSSTTESTDYKLGTAAFTEGGGTKANGNYSHAEGYGTTASGAYSHAEGRSSTASGSVSHAEGTDTVASGIRSHASGWGTIAKGQNQTAIGKYNVEDTSEKYALIVGNGTSTARSNAFTIDWSGNAEAGGEKLATEAYVDNAIPNVSNKMDKINPIGTGSFSLNRKADTTIGDGSFAEGHETTASGSYSHAKGWNTEASGWSSSAEGANTEASGESSHAEGEGTTASGYSSHSEGIYTTALGANSHAEGRSENRFINYISSENPTKDEIINARNNHAFNIASGDYSHSEGDNSAAIGKASHAEGCTIASGDYSHAEGSTIASGDYSHTEGQYSKASGRRSHAEGYGTTASSNDQHVQGKFNIDDSSNIYADIIGNGTESNKRSNAATVDWSGNAWYAGNVYVGSTSGKNKDEGSKKLATEDYVSTQISAIPTPDVSGQINTHNTSSSAHNDIRQSISGKASASDLTNHTSNSTIHVTSTEKTKWDAKSNFSGSYNDLSNKPTIPTKTSQLTNDSGYLTSAPVTSVNGKTGAITLSASDIGALPASTQIPSISGLATETYVNNKVAGIVNSAPETLDTLDELAEALGNDPNFATTVANQIGNKVDKVDGKGLSTNDYTTAEKNKLAGIATGANNYTHPTTSGNKHIPSGGSSGQILRWSADGTAVWGADNNTDTKVTSVGNHYTPSGGNTTSASGGTLTDITNSSSGVQVLTGVTKDAAGHVTGVTSLALKSVNTVYTHPSTHPAIMITEDSTHRFVTDGEKAAWNESDVFIATYGITTFDELVNAYNSGKTIIAKNNGYIYQLYTVDTSNSFMFMSILKTGNYVQYIECEFTNDWYSYNGKQFLPDVNTSYAGKYLSVSSNGSVAWTNLPTDTNKVDLSSAQTISGAKTFSADLAASSNLTVGGNITATGTITGSKVYNAVWNDYAEWFEKDNEEEIFTPGEICIWTGNGVTKSTKANDKAVVGIVSDSYGHILGGEDLKDMEENNKKFVPIGLKGRVKCKVTGPVEIGDLIVTSDITGVGIVNNNANNGIIVGKALENSNDTGIKEIIVLI